MGQKMRKQRTAFQRQFAFGLRTGISMLEVLVVLGIGALLIALAIPATLAWRETARLNQCRENLHVLSFALASYHDVHRTLPPAAIWSVNATVSLALYDSRQIDRITHQNWTQLLLPHLGEEKLADQFDPLVSIGADQNADARLTSFSTMNCPADHWNRVDNPYEFQLSDAEPVRRFARGNYGINGGSQNSQMSAPNTSSARGEVTSLEISEQPRRFRMWGNGIAGINQAFSLDEFENGLGTLIALEELRAGIHATDPRGVWALGQIGGSITWAHGVQGDASQPNSPFYRSDDLFGCGAVHAAVGSVKLEELNMPCCHYVDRNAQAAARSMHPGGVNVAFLDGAVRFLSDQIDPGLWHVLHSRETPRTVLGSDLEEILSIENFPEAAEPKAFRQADSSEEFVPMQNSLGMSFLKLPAGVFLMGLADIGNSFEPPVDVPAHLVRISQPFYLATCEVTRKEYRQLMEDESTSGPKIDHADFPMVDVTWELAHQFCRQLSERPEERAAGRMYRLPTEAEWEYACRAGAKTAYVWRQKRSANDLSGEAAGIMPEMPLTAVGSYPPNPWGLYDMRGNAWEWCADWFDRDYYLRSSKIDPQGPQVGFLKVVRGSDWRFIGEACRHDYVMLPPWKSNPVVGFRVVCVIDPTHQEAPNLAPGETPGESVIAR